MINFKKAVSMVVVFSLVLCSCGGNKNKGGAGDVPDPVARYVQMIYVVNGVETEVRQDDSIEAGKDVNPEKRYTNCSLDKKDDVLECTDEASKSKSTFRIKEFIYEGQHYNSSKKNLRCIVENKGGRCERPPIKCEPQDGSEKCKPKYMYVEGVSGEKDAAEKLKSAVEAIKVASGKTGMTLLKAIAQEADVERAVAALAAAVKTAVPDVVTKMTGSAAAVKALETMSGERLWLEALAAVKALKATAEALKSAVEALKSAVEAEAMLKLPVKSTDERASIRAAVKSLVKTLVAAAVREAVKEAKEEENKRNAETEAFERERELNARAFEREWL